KTSAVTLTRSMDSTRQRHAQLSSENWLLMCDADHTQSASPSFRTVPAGRGQPVTGTACQGGGRTTPLASVGISLSYSKRGPIFVRCTSFLCIASSHPLQTKDYPWLVSLVTADSSKTVLPSLPDTRVVSGSREGEA